MSNTAPAKQVRKPKKLPFVIMCILSAIVAVLNVLLCVLVPKYYTTIKVLSCCNRFLERRKRKAL